jgi:Flp pilus assembly pilin Flp
MSVGERVETMKNKKLSAEQMLRALLRDERGQDLIEYALLVGFMVIAIYVVLPNDLMPTVSKIFSRIVTIFASTAT